MICQILLASGDGFTLELSYTLSSYDSTQVQIFKSQEAPLSTD